MNFGEYVRAGWSICAIDRGKKSPTYPAWNTKPIPPDAADGLDGAGLLHALSGTAALDIDDIKLARPWLAERGVDLDELLGDDCAVQIVSGRPGRAKLLYTMKRPLRSFRPKQSGLELRCATAALASVQDVLPPTIHPDTQKPYTWSTGILGDWRHPPAIPAGLLSIWRSLSEGDTEVEKYSVFANPERRPRVDLAKLRRAAFKHSPDCEYDEWIRVGMQLHDGSRGTQEGFDIWCEWSRGIKRAKYPGDESLKSHWVSFDSGGGKHVASGAALVNELPADADEFPLEDDETNPVLADALEAAQKETTKKEMDRQANVSRQAATETLEKRLIFVRNSERYFDTEYHRIIGSNDTIEHLFSSMMPKKVNPVKLLKASKSKRIVDSLAFHPGESAVFDYGGETFANNYRNRLPEPIIPTTLEMEKITWLFDRIDDPLYREWLMQFYGHVVQRPGVKIKSAPLIWSETQGNGKSTLVQAIPMLLVGRHYSKEVTFSLLNSDFNDYLVDAWHVNLTEFRAGTRGEREAISKKIENWIADDTISIHPKGMRGYTMPNHMFLTASSNKDDAASIDNNDRKWAIHELHAAQFTPSEQQWIYPEFLLTDRAAGVLRHFFLDVSLAGFHPSAKAPETTSRSEMVEASITPDQELLETAFEQCSEPLTKDVVITSEVGDYVRRHCQNKPSNKRVGRMLCRPPLNGVPIQFRIGTSRYRAVVIRNHQQWNGAVGTAIMAHISGNDVDLTA